MRFYFLVLLLILLCKVGWAQQNNLFLRGQSHIGFIISHSESIKDLTNTNPWGFQLESGLIFKNQKAWSKCNCFSKVGLNFSYFNYQNPSELGNSYNLILFGEPYLGFKSNLFLTLKGGMGITYLNQVFDEVDNPRNFFYSSPISFLLMANLGLNWKVNPHHIVQLAVNYNHISNGGLKQPNKGMNFPTISLGLEKIWGNPSFPILEKTEGLLATPWRKYLYMAGRPRSVEADSLFQKTSHVSIGLELGVMRSISNINALGLGAELYADGAQAEISQREGGVNNPLLLSLTLGHSLVFGSFSFNQFMGVYTYKPVEFNDKRLFQRYSVNYQLGKYLNLGVSLKAYAHVADYLDLRLGIVW